MVVYRAESYGPNVNAGRNMNADNGWGPYKWPGGVPSALLATAHYGDIFVTVRKELVELAELTLQLAHQKYGYKVNTRNPNGNGENWGPWGYQNRAIANSNTASNHSRGRAMDWNAPNNGYANGFANIRSDFPPEMVAAIESLGWGWGGRYGDAMHWEYAYSPDDVAGHVKRARQLLAGVSQPGKTPSKPSQGTPQADKPVSTPEPVAQEEEDEDMLNTIQVDGKNAIFAYGPGQFFGLTDMEIYEVGLDAKLWKPVRTVNQREFDVTKTVALQLGQQGEANLGIAK